MKNQGFTLIELVVVIVILGILAVTAAPKFIDLNSDARQAVIKGVKGSLESAVSLAHSKALVSGETGATGEIQIGNDFYALVYGYPASAGAGNANGETGHGFGVTELIDIDTSDDGDLVVTTIDPALIIYKRAPTPGSCLVSYLQATGSNTGPEITTTVTGC